MSSLKVESQQHGSLTYSLVSSAEIPLESHSLISVPWGTAGFLGYTGCCPGSWRPPAAHSCTHILVLSQDLPAGTSSASPGVPIGIARSNPHLVRGRSGWILTPQWDEGRWVPYSPCLVTQAHLHIPSQGFLGPQIKSLCPNPHVGSLLEEPKLGQTLLSSHQ